MSVMNLIFFQPPIVKMISKGAKMDNEKLIFNPAATLPFAAFSLDLSSFFVFPDLLETLQTRNL